MQLAVGVFSLILDQEDHDFACNCLPAAESKWLDSVRRSCGDSWAKAE